MFFPKKSLKQRLYSLEKENKELQEVRSSCQRVLGMLNKKIEPKEHSENIPCVCFIAEEWGQCDHPTLQYTKKQGLSVWVYNPEKGRIEKRILPLQRDKLVFNILIENNISIENIRDIRAEY